jgi:hypothetical protein
MSKITIVGGDIIEWTGGTNVSFAKKAVINSSSMRVRQKGEEEIILGTCDYEEKLKISLSQWIVS